MPTVFTWEKFRQDMDNVDPDFRQMALFDLNQELLKEDFKLSDPEQLSSVTHVAKCFGKAERNSEVHSNAVRLLGALVKKLDDSKREQLVAKLVEAVCDTPADVPKDQQQMMRANASMGLKMITENLRRSESCTAMNAAVPLVRFLQRKADPKNKAPDDEKVKMDVYDVLSDLVEAFGRELASQHEALYGLIELDWAGNDNSLRKKVVNCLSRLCPHLNDAVYGKVVEHLKRGLKNSKGEALRRVIQLCNSVSRCSAARFGSAVPEIVTLLFVELDRLALDEEPRSDETRENILQTLECIVSRCPGSVTGHLPKIISESAKLLAWDPNYCDDGVEEDLDAEGDAVDEEFEDDDDISWTVRKAAAKCIAEVIRARSDKIDLIFAALLNPSDPLLPSRFRERVETVRVEILETFKTLLKACSLVVPAEQQGDSGSGIVSSMFTGGSFRMVVVAKREASGLSPVKEACIKALLSCAKHRSAKVKLLSFVTLSEFYGLLGNDLMDFIKDSVAVIVSTLNNKDPRQTLPQLRPEVLTFARLVVYTGVSLLNNPANGFLVAELESLVPKVEENSKDRYFKTTVAALKVLLELVRLIPYSSQKEGLTRSLFKIVYERLETVDADQDVKRAAIDAISSLLKNQHKILTTQIPKEVKAAQELLLEMLKNDTTRLAAAKAVQNIVPRCPLESTVVNGFAGELTSLLRKTDRQVRESAIRTLNVLIPEYLGTIEKKIYDTIVEELCSASSALLSDKELFLTSLSIVLARNVSQAPNQQKAALTTMVPCTIQLLANPLVQGQPVKEAGVFFKSLATNKNCDFTALLNTVTSSTSKATTANATNIAVAIGSVVANDSDPKRLSSNVAKYSTMAAQNNDAIVGVAVLGEIGRYQDLTSHGGADLLLKSLVSPRDEVRLAASTAIGRASSLPCGKKMFTKLIHECATANEKYYLFKALREAIVAASLEPVSCLSAPDERAALRKLLLERCHVSSNDGLPDLVAECLGRAAPFDVAGVVTDLKALMSENDEVKKTSATTALKHAAASLTKSNDDDTVRSVLPYFLCHLSRSGTTVLRRALLQLLTSIVHSKPIHLLVPEFKSHIFPSLLEELKVDEKNITILDLGPFKHREDKGLELRKVAYECLSNLIDGQRKPHSLLDYVGCYDGIVGVLSDAVSTSSPATPTSETDLDIQHFARSMLLKMMNCPAACASIVKNIDVLAKRLQTNVKSTKVPDGVDVDKFTDGIKHTIVLLIKLEGLSEISSRPAFVESLTAAKENANFAAAAKIASEQ